MFCTCFILIFILLMIKGFIVKMLFHSAEVRSHPLPLAPPPRMPVATPDHDFIRCVVQLVDKTLPVSLKLEPIYMCVCVYSEIETCKKIKRFVLCSRGKKCYSSICYFSGLFTVVYMYMLFLENYCILLQ